MTIKLIQMMKFLKNGHKVNQNLLKTKITIVILVSIRKMIMKI